MTKTFYYVSACAGSGKTTGAIKSISKGIRHHQRYVLAQPTIELCEATADRLKEAGVDALRITSRQYPGRVHSEFIRAISGELEKVIIVTHAALLACANIAGKNQWNLIVDEVLPVDQSFLANVSLSYREIIKHLDLRDNPFNDRVFDVIAKPQSLSLLRAWARNAPEDDIKKVTQSFWAMVVNPHYSVSVNRGQHVQASLAKKTQLIAHGVLHPSVLSGWQRVTIMGANFEHSLMHMIWSAEGVTFEPDQTIKVSDPQHSAATGARATIQFLSEEGWSKNLLEKIGGIATVTKALAPHVSGNYIWAANNDVADSQWAMPGGERIPVMAQGLNCYRHYNQVVFLPALNDNPAHFRWAKQQYGIEPYELHRAKAMEAAYQAVMRSNLREPDGIDPVTITVADRNTAEYLASLLPGSTLKFFDLGIEALKRKRQDRDDRPPAKTSAERQQALRERTRKFEKTIGDLKLLARSELGSTDDGLVTPIISFERDTFSLDVLPERFDGFDQLRDLLRESWELRIARKEDNILMSGATFAAGDGAETRKGLDAFLYSQMIQLDFDDSDLPPEQLTVILHGIRHIAYNSFSNVNRIGQYRYRVMIPLASPVDKEIYEGLWDMIAERIAEAGFAVGKEICPGKARSGLDRSKRTPVSWMYLPAQASKKGNSFWLENWDEPMLDPADYIGRLAQASDDIDVTELVADKNIDVNAVAVNIESKEEKPAGGAVSDPNHKQNAIDKAVRIWRSTSAGEGNEKFFDLGVALKRAGCSRDEICMLLDRHHAESGSKAKDRRKQIPSIVRSLSRSRQGLSMPQ